MFNLDNIARKDDNNNNWLFRYLVVGHSGSGKTNYLLKKNTKKQQYH